MTSHEGLSRKIQHLKKTLKKLADKGVAVKILVPQHKDVELAKPLAEALACLLHYPVVISAGIHSEDLSRAELETIIKNSEELKNKVLRDLETYFVREASEKDF